MATHKGKYVSYAIKRAAKDYVCEISGDTISKGEHYLNIQVATDKVGYSRYANTFIVQETFTIALSQLAHKSLSQILDLLPPFLDEKDKKIAELKDEIKRLKLRLNQTFGIGGIHLITKDTPIQSLYPQLMFYKYVQDDLRVTELVTKDRVIRSQENKITELKKDLAQIKEDAATTIHRLWDKQVELQGRIGELQMDRDIAQNEMETLRQKVISLKSSLENETGTEGKVRRDERIAELEHENQFLKEHIKILGGLR